MRSLWYFVWLLVNWKYEASPKKIIRRDWGNASHIGGQISLKAHIRQSESADLSIPFATLLTQGFLYPWPSSPCDIAPWMRLFLRLHCSLPQVPFMMAESAPSPPPRTPRTVAKQEIPPPGNISKTYGSCDYPCDPHRIRKTLGIPLLHTHKLELCRYIHV